MPFKSKAQQGFMFAAEKRGDIKPGTAERFAKATPNIKKLPQHAAHGALVHSQTYETDMDALHKTAPYGGMAYGGTSDGDEAQDRYPDEEYGGPVEMNAAYGATVTCPHCGGNFAHGGNVGRHMQPGFQDMDPETADREADMHLGQALMRQKDRHFADGGEVDPYAAELYRRAMERKKGQ